MHCFVVVAVLSTSIIS